MKIIQIDGIKGLITAVFVCACAFAGFVISPAYVVMSLWNKYLAQEFLFPSLSMFQGVLLWAIIVMTYCIVANKGFALSFKNTPEISDEELNSILRVAKLNAKKKMLSKITSDSDKFIKKSDCKTNCSSLPKEEMFVSSPIQTKTASEKEESDSSSITNVK